MKHRVDTALLEWVSEHAVRACATSPSFALWRTTAAQN